jgi:hypothetical protein
MMWRTAVACGQWVLGASGCVAAALALSAAPAGAAACGNEQLRRESRVSPATGQPYSTALPDCRAYELVSPAYKASRDVFSPGGSAAALPVAPDGDGVGFASEGPFAEPENQIGGISAYNYYTAHRGESAWATSSAFAPAKLLPVPNINGLSSDFSPDLRSMQASCGAAYRGEVESVRSSVLCATRKLGGPWVSTPRYQASKADFTETKLEPLGGSSDLSRLFIRPESPLLPEDTTIRFAGAGAGIYEIAGVGTESRPPRLVNVDSQGKALLINTGGQAGFGALLGDSYSNHFNGTAYQAISENGETVFFGATPEASRGSEGQSLYARIHCTVGPHCHEDGNHEYLETVEVSASSPECTTSTCEPSTAVPHAVFEGASADGSKVFFTTAQQLVPQDTNGALDLYEYHFITKQEEEEGKKRLTLISEISGSTLEEEVIGVVRTSSDGSHVYFVARGVLTPEPNLNGEKAVAGSENLYGYDTLTGKMKFVAATTIEGIRESIHEESSDEERHAQSTPDGRDLVFSSRAQLAGDLNTGCTPVCPEAVYLYDFDTGALTWVSHGAPGFKVENQGAGAYKGGGRDALVAPLPGTADGANADSGDWSRAISGCPKGVSREERGRCPEGKYDGEFIIFATTEKLQANDVNEAADVYAWHNGTVRMISDGYDRQAGTANPGASGISASGSDVFFFTQTALTGQDTDVLGDLYDARIDGGFPAPAVEASCSGEQCQGTPSSPPVFGSSASSVFPAGGNLSPLGSVAPFTQAKPPAKPKPLTQAQKLAKALKACKARPRKTRAACEAQARSRYGKKANAKRKVKAGKGNGRRG